MSHIVVISGHPELAKSNTNSLILDRIGNHFDSIDVRRLDSLYPDYRIDVEAEQQALLNADVVVLQFPFFWYSMPALLKKWLDDVFSYNFAYGSKGDKLKGKQLLLSFTIGGPAESYDPLGYNHFAIEQFMFPFQQTAYLSGMIYNKPIYSHGMVYIPGVYNTLEAVQANAQSHAQRLIAAVEQLIGSDEPALKQFAQDWFAVMDQLPENNLWLTDHVAEQALFVTPDGEFVGPQGFNDWYQVLRSVFKPGGDHNIEQLQINRNDLGYQLDLRIRLQAETHSGKQLNMLVNEQWQLQLRGGKPQILRYAVEPVQG